MSGWQQTLIGSILASPSAMAEVEELLPSDFTGHNSDIWAEMIALSKRGALEVRAVAEILKSPLSGPRLLDADAYLTECISMAGTGIREYGDRVMEESIRRHMQKAAALIAIEAQGNIKKVPELLDYAEKQILSLRRNRLNSGMSMADLYAIFMPRMEGLRTGSVTPKFVPQTQAVRDILYYAEDSDLITVAGRPGEGKSSFLRFEAYSRSQYNQRTLIINLENDPMDYGRAFLSLKSNINSDLLKNPRQLSPAQLEVLQEAAFAIARMPMTLMNMHAPSFNQIAQVVRRFAAEHHDLSLVQLDYVQLVNNGQENRVQDITTTSGGMKALSGELNIPIMQAAQLSRAIETRTQGAEPQLSDLRDSGSLEQDSTIVIFVRLDPTGPATLQTYPENVNNGRLVPLPNAVPIRFFVKKNRNGKTGTSEVVKWIKSTGRYENIS